MLFNYPSFIGEKEQTQSELLFNSVKMVIQTHVKEIWVDLDFGTNIRDLIKQGIDDLVLLDVKSELETKINKYFSNDLVILKLAVQQGNGNKVDTIQVDLKYQELRTGKQYTIQSSEEITVLNNDNTTLY